MKDTPHIYWFAYFDASEPSVRYRAKYPLQLLSKEGRITYDMVEPSYRPVKILRFLKVYFSALLFRKEGSVIVFEKIRTRRAYATALRLLAAVRARDTVYDIDDADYVKFPPGTIYFFMRRCERCIVGSAALATVASRYSGNTHMLTSPVIDHEHIKKVRNKIFTIGWVGYYNAHRESLLQLLFPALLRVHMPLQLVLLGVTKEEHRAEVNAYFAKCTHVTVEMPGGIDWQDEEGIYERIAKFDIGVAPLLDTELGRAKSAFKLKQYLSCGVPALASDIGENSAFLQHGMNGYLCRNADEYAHYIEVITQMDDASYRQMSENALRSREAFNMWRYCDGLLQHIGGRRS